MNKTNESEAAAKLNNSTPENRTGENQSEKRSGALWKIMATQFGALSGREIIADHWDDLQRSGPSRWCARQHWNTQESPESNALRLIASAAGSHGRCAERSVTELSLGASILSGEQRQRMIGIFSQAFGLLPEKIQQKWIRTYVVKTGALWITEATLKSRSRELLWNQLVNQAINQGKLTELLNFPEAARACATLPRGLEEYRGQPEELLGELMRHPAWRPAALHLCEQTLLRCPGALRANYAALARQVANELNPAEMWSLIERNSPLKHSHPEIERRAQHPERTSSLGRLSALKMGSNDAILHELHLKRTTDHGEAAVEAWARWTGEWRGESPAGPAQELRRCAALTRLIHDLLRAAVELSGEGQLNPTRHLAILHRAAELSTELELSLESLSSAGGQTGRRARLTLRQIDSWSLSGAEIGKATAARPEQALSPRISGAA